MVHEANVKQAAAEKQLKEAQGKVSPARPSVFKEKFSQLSHHCFTFHPPRSTSYKRR